MKSACSYEHAKIVRLQNATWREGIKHARPNQSLAMRRRWRDRPSREKYLAVIGTNHASEFLDRRGRVWRFKSTWELRFARVLDEQGLSWTYEPCALLLSDGRTYVPDFWVEEWRRYVEIKALHRSSEKIELAQHDGHDVLLLQGQRALDAFIEART